MRKRNSNAILGIMDAPYGQCRNCSSTFSIEEARHIGPLREVDLTLSHCPHCPPVEADPPDHHETLELLIPTDELVERVWRDYWVPLLSPGGVFSMEALKGELFDAWHLVNEARKVYRHVTGGITDDLSASAEGIIAMAERNRRGS